MIVINPSTGSISCLPLRRSHRRQVRDRDSDGDNMQYGDDDDTTSWTVRGILYRLKYPLYLQPRIMKG